jgi:ADP-ribosylglycohydrolase
VINHGKHQFWGKPGVHYHQGMVAGENTLNAVCARVVLRGITDNQGTYSKAKFLEDYVKFMTTPGTHNDTYAESFHRDFFKNWAAGVPPEKCAEVRQW